MCQVAVAFDRESEIWRGRFRPLSEGALSELVIEGGVYFDCLKVLGIVRKPCAARDAGIKTVLPCIVSPAARTNVDCASHFQM